MIVTIREFPARMKPWIAGAAAVLALLAGARPAVGQDAAAHARCDVLDVEEVWQVPGQAPPEYCRPAPSHFRLFGGGDFAGTGMRLADANLYGLVTNTGLMDTGNFATIACCTLPMATRGTASAPGGINYQYFEVQFYEAAARSDWLRNREKVPALQKVKGGGWTFIANLGRMSSIHMFEGADGSAGLLHSGVVSAAGGCRDHGGNWINYPHGFPLLAGSDCPETWGAQGWRGRRPVNEEGWIREFQEKGSEFSFDFWRVDPDNFVPPSERQFIGDFQTFGSMSDHGRDHRARYGEVIPGQSGEPSIQGYPPGLVWEFNAYSFKIPTVAGMFIYEALLINRSEELYGVPLDYDSLYVGIEPRWLRAGSGGSGRRAAVYPLPNMGAVVSNELGVTPNCNGGLRVPTSVSCPGTSNTRGFRAGASGFVFLKSPIGDLRFKHFSDPASPFYSPGHPNAGDTITFNRLSLCGFECTNAQFSTLSMRRGWGTIAADVNAALDGRDPNLLSIREYWMLFKPAAGSDTRVDPTNPRGPGGFNYYVPGVKGDPNPVWSYSNRPPGAPTGPDTLYFDTCNPVTNECVELWSDTLPDKTLNWAYNASWFGAGPFPLKAGDTTAFVVAAFAAPDSTRFMALLQDIYNFYVNDFYLGPGVPTPPNIVAAVPQAGSRGRGETGVTLILDDAAASWRDAFAIKYVDRLAEAPEGTELGRIRALNPGLVDELRARVEQNNVSRVLVFKSCNGGRSFTATRGGDRCPADEAVDEAGQPMGTGWRAYSVLKPDSRGKFPTTFRDASVTGGRSYLYALVAESDGIELLVNDSVDVTGDGVFDRVERVPLRVLPASRSALQTVTDLPYVASVYVPASHQAGSEPARAVFTAEAGPVPTSTGLVSVDVVAGVPAQKAYSLAFGDSARVLAYGPAARPDSTVVLLYRSARTGFDDDGAPVYTHYATARYRSTSSAGVVVAASSSQTASEVQDGATVTRIRAPAGVVVESGGAPLFVSASLTGDAFTPPEVFSHPGFGGFLVSARSSPGSKLSEAWALNGDELRSASWPTIGWLDDAARATGARYGMLEAEWEGPAFAGRVEIDLRNPASTAQQYAAAVTGRASVSRTATDAATAELVAAALELAPEEVELADLPLPFRMVRDDGTEARVAVLASDLPSEVLLGSGLDTMTVPVPENTWIPGVRMVLIEDVPVAETDAGGAVLLGPDGRPRTRTEPRVTWSAAVLGCGDRASCNPVVGPGQNGYVSIRPGMALRVAYADPLTGESEYSFDLLPARVGEDIASVPSNALSAVRVVPNPYIALSAYEQQQGSRRIMFTNLPPEGRIRIFTASGQFVQEMTWGPEDLQGNGDLFYNLRTREDTELVGGLYLYVVEALGAGSGAQKKIGKFIIIR